MNTDMTAKEEILQLIDQCLEDNNKDKKKTLYELEKSTVNFARMINQKLMQLVADKQGAGYQGNTIIVEGKKARYKGSEPKKNNNTNRRH